MISFVEENVQNDSVFEGLVPHDYSGYTIIESAMDTINFVSEAFSDIQMSTLLEEYKYLYENGVEMVYEEDETAASEETESKEGKKSNILSKIFDAIKKWGEKMYGIFQTAMQKIQAVATSVSTRVGVSKKDFDAVDAGYIKVIASKLDSSFEKDPSSIDVKSMLIDDWHKDDIPEISAQEIVKQFVKSENPSGNEAWYSKQAISNAVFGGYKNIGKKILDARKEVTNEMNKNIKAAKKAKTEDMASIMTNYNKAMKHNTAVVGGLLHVFAVYAKQCKVIAQNAIKMSKNASKTASDNKDAANKTGKAGTVARQKASEANRERHAKIEDNVTKQNQKVSNMVHRYQSTKQELKDEKKAEKEAKKADSKNEKAGKKFFGRK